MSLLPLKDLKDRVSEIISNVLNGAARGTQLLSRNKIGITDTTNGMGSLVNNAANSIMFAQQDNKRSSKDTIISPKSIIKAIGKAVGGPVGDIIGVLGNLIPGFFGSNNQNQSTNSTAPDTIGALGGVLGGALGGNVFGSNNQNQSTNSTAP
ncbi:MAG: hypothetical protein INF44_07205, partial [Thalassospira sp.]|nr:hypothetical protein [Thalassospira sp.]